MKKVIYMNGINELSTWRLERELNNHFQNDTILKMKSKNFFFTNVKKQIKIKTMRGNTLIIKEKFII